MLRKISLRNRITLLTALILVVSSILLTGVSIYSASASILPATTIAVASEIPAHEAAIEGEIDENPIVYQSEMTSSFAAENTTAPLDFRPFRQRSILYTVLIIIIGSFIIWFVMGRALHPLDDLISEMEAIDENNLQTALKEPKNKDEISKITTSFNNMIKKINSGVALQKRFSSNVSHELTTPLTSIIANIEVLEFQEKPSEEDYSETLFVVKEQALRMNAIIKDLKSMNQLVAIENFETFALKDLLDELLNSFQEDILDKNLSVSVKGNTKIMGNYSLLERAFSNIIHNAIRYNRENGEIAIVMEENQATITDTGRGIKTENLDKIFEAFYCEDMSRSKELGGTGLGLYITKEILERHHFEIEVESSSKGTSFKLIFQGAEREIDISAKQS